MRERPGKYHEGAVTNVEGVNWVAGSVSESRKNASVYVHAVGRPADDQHLRRHRPRQRGSDESRSRARQSRSPIQETWWSGVTTIGDCGHLCAPWCVDHDAPTAEAIGVAGWTRCEGEPEPLTWDGKVTLTRARWGSNDPNDPKPDDFDGYLLQVGFGEESELNPAGSATACGAAAGGARQRRQVTRDVGRSYNTLCRWQASHTVGRPPACEVGGGSRLVSRIGPGVS